MVGLYPRALSKPASRTVPSHGKVHATRGDEAGSLAPDRGVSVGPFFALVFERPVAQRRQRDGEGVTVVGMHHVGLEAPANLEQPPRDPRVGSDGPTDLLPGNSLAQGPLRQGAAILRHEGQRDGRPLRQLPAQQPHLVLAAPPLAAGVDLQDPQGGIAQAPAFASPTPPPSTRRSSASVKGLWRKGRPRRSRNCRVSPRTVSPVAKMMRSASSGWSLASFRYISRPPSLGIRRSQTMTSNPSARARRSEEHT